MNDTETGRRADTGTPDGPAGTHDPVAAVVDWLLAVVAGLIGLVTAGVGVALYTEIDRATIAAAVTGENVQLEGITPEEAIAAGVPFVDWLGVGVALTGLVLLGAAVAFVVGRRRTRRRVEREGGTTATAWACAAYGAVVTAVVSFVPGSALVGGAGAAYLRGEDGSYRTGAAAGLLGTLLTVPLLVGVVIGLLAGAAAGGR
jgi:hypothetical protein